MDEKRIEEIRDRFWKIAKIDLHNLESDEIASLLKLLPLVQSYLFQSYDMSHVFRADDEEDEVASLRAQVAALEASSAFQIGSAIINE